MTSNQSGDGILLPAELVLVEGSKSAEGSDIGKLHRSLTTGCISPISVIIKPARIGA